MNKAFTKDDTSHEPVLIPPRAPLPEGLVNYVTPRGLSALRQDNDSMRRVQRVIRRERTRVARHRKGASQNTAA